MFRRAFYLFQRKINVPCLRIQFRILFIKCPTSRETIKDKWNRLILNPPPPFTWYSGTNTSHDSYLIFFFSSVILPQGQISSRRKPISISSDTDTLYFHSLFSTIKFTCFYLVTDFNRYEQYGFPYFPDVLYGILDFIDGPYMVHSCWTVLNYSFLSTTMVLFTTNTLLYCDEIGRRSL